MIVRSPSLDIPLRHLPLLLTPCRPPGPPPGLRRQASLWTYLLRADPWCGLCLLRTQSSTPCRPLGPPVPLLGTLRKVRRKHLLDPCQQACRPLSSPYRVPEYPLQGPLRSLEELEGAFPALPKELCNTCRALRGGPLPAEARALRAWKAGCWARSILEGWSEVTKPSEPVGISNRVYCVIAARGLSCPAVVHSFASYKKIVGELRRGESISHAFPSEAEARLYFAGAGVDYPSA